MVSAGECSSGTISVRTRDTMKLNMITGPASERANTQDIVTYTISREHMSMLAFGTLRNASMRSLDVLSRVHTHIHKTSRSPQHMCTHRRHSERQGTHVFTVYRCRESYTLGRIPTHAFSHPPSRMRKGRRRGAERSTARGGTEWRDVEREAARAIADA